MAQPELSRQRVGSRLHNLARNQIAAALQGLSQRRCEKGTRLFHRRRVNATQSMGGGELELARRIAKGRLQPERLTTILRVGWFLGTGGVFAIGMERVGLTVGLASHGCDEPSSSSAAGNSSAGGWGLAPRCSKP